MCSVGAWLLLVSVPFHLQVAIYRRIKLGKIPEKRNLLQYAVPKYSVSLSRRLGLIVQVVLVM